MENDWKDIAERAGWTAVQAGLGAIVTVPLLTDVEGWETALLAAGTAAVGALLSFGKTLAQEQLGVIETRPSHIEAGVPEHTEDEFEDGPLA
jgi:cyanate permease